MCISKPFLAASQYIIPVPTSNAPLCGSEFLSPSHLKPRVIVHSSFDAKDRAGIEKKSSDTFEDSLMADFNEDG